MTLADWLERLEALQPEHIELGLQRVQKVLASLALDFSNSKIITIAGTNGKGSVVAFLEAIYQQQDIATLAYTSPHILNYNERIRINGKAANDTQLVKAFEQVEHARQDIPLTYFEFGTLAALVLLAEYQPPVALLEVGLGGRLDAVNCVDADVAVITSIGIDHTDWLGNDRNSIAAEKAGIMRLAKPVVCGELDPPACIAEIADHKGADLFQYSQHYQYQQPGVLQSDWQQPLAVQQITELSDHQRINALTALAAVTLPDTGLPLLSRQVLSAGAWLVSPPARMQQLGQRPDIYLDIAHNPAAAVALAAELSRVAYPSTVAVLAMLADKDVTGVVEALGSVIDHWYLAPTSGPRGLTVMELQQLVAKATQSASTGLQSISEALQQAKDDSDSNGRIIILGTFANATVLLGESQIDAEMCRFN